MSSIITEIFDSSFNLLKLIFMTFSFCDCHCLCFQEEIMYVKLSERLPVSFLPKLNLGV